MMDSVLQLCPLILVESSIIIVSSSPQKEFTGWSVPSDDLVEMAAVSHSEESIGFRIELKLSVMIKGIPNIRCLCEKIPI